MIVLKVIKIFLLKNSLMLLVVVDIVCRWQCILFGSGLKCFFVVFFVIGVSSGCIICGCLLRLVNFRVVVVLCINRQMISRCLVVVLWIFVIYVCVCFFRLWCFSSLIIVSGSSRINGRLWVFRKFLFSFFRIVVIGICVVMLVMILEIIIISIGLKCNIKLIIIMVMLISGQRDIVFCIIMFCLVVSIVSVVNYLI